MSDVRQHLGDAIQNVAGMNDELEGAVLTGWVIVAEWMAPTGNRWLSQFHGSANGDRCPNWQLQGYLHNALFDGFEEFVAEPDEDDEEA